VTVDIALRISLFPPTREEQLQAEVNDLHAKLELAHATIEQLQAPGRSLPSGKQPLAVLGGGLIGECEGYLWLLRDNAVLRLSKALPEEIAQADALREVGMRQMAERRRSMS
jgi:hypothetical protein